MNLTLETLAANGGFVSRQPVPEEITITNDEGEEYTATVYVLPLSYVTAKSDIVATQLKSDPLAARIAHCIVDEEGQRVFTVEDVTGEADPERGPLSNSLTHELLRVIGKVTKLGKRPASSTKKTKSGTSSSSTGSAAGRSKKRKPASATPSSSAG
ncbi:phage tail assembly chaperone family protein, TAC [Vreelandella boliviensis]|uniref:phage tail assembly chaperone family protein, TAC n=1 Tax=Vreelandella boliviensis TaxID=223527 RepID=UPI001B8ADE3A|nr:phage tail assembly chaperone family protein, TAC [Halomonas boliviensis]MBS3670198.1 phage tail assembly chaperone family protein, TAC [Halomonas boliviensis]